MGLMRQSVHPMEHRKSNSLEEYENEMAASPSQRIADQQQPPQATAANGGSPRGSDVQAASATANMTARSAAAATTTDYTGDPSGGGSRTTGASNYTQDEGGGDSQTARQPYSQGTKSDRRLVFADESGGALAEITYSSRTHYSKQAGAGNLPAGRACCVIS